MQGSDGDAHQEDADGDLASNRGEAVGDFAEPPVLHCGEAIFDGKAFELITCTINRATDHGSAEHGVP